MQSQNQDGTFQPPTSQESTDIPAEGLGNPQPMEMKRMTLTEADLMRARRTYSPLVQTDEMLSKRKMFNEIALEVAKVIIEVCPEGKERSQALGSLNQVVLWCQASIDMKEAEKNENIS